MWRTTVVHGMLVMKVEGENRELAGILEDVLDGVKEIGDKMERGYPGLVLLRKVA